MKSILNNDECPFCLGAHLRRFRTLAHDAPGKNVFIIECRQCQAAWQWPLQRTEQQSSDEFNGAYKNKSAGSYFDLERRTTVAACQRDFLASLGLKPGRLLDIGCGDGTFANAMAEAGWEVVGIDPALKAVQSRGSRVVLRNEALEELPKHELFDLITLWDVVEHVERPDTLLGQASALLARDGTLVVETGNYQSAGRVLSNDRWWNYQIDHRWYLAPPQLEDLVKLAGLQRVEFADRVLRPWWKGRATMRAPSTVETLRALVRRPWRAFATWQVHRQLDDGARQWRDWGGLEIMTMVARR